MDLRNVYVSFKRMSSLVEAILKDFRLQGQV